MIWEDVKMFDLIDSGADELGNPLQVTKLVGTTRARATPWTVVDANILPRAVLKENIKLFLAVDRQALKQVKIIEYKVREYKVVAIMASSPRGSIVQLERADVWGLT